MTYRPIIPKNEDILESLGKIEDFVATLDSNTSLTSIAISLKRIADALQEMNRNAEFRSSILSGTGPRDMKR